MACDPRSIGAGPSRCPHPHAQPAVAYLDISSSARDHHIYFGAQSLRSRYRPPSPYPWLHPGRYHPTLRIGAGRLVRPYPGWTYTSKNHQASLGAQCRLYRELSRHNLANIVRYLIPILRFARSIPYYYITTKPTFCQYSYEQFFVNFCLMADWRARLCRTAHGLT